ncbi:hypothetical protein [Neolewinella agarilytica]|uniref:hypothetical protein n=1 Tax=Neolewinella agarilytica TaxID=478744 RepID=UPI0023538FAB|nr:hypothetical protein [Neolewinella agarilytica]
MKPLFTLVLLALLISSCTPLRVVRLEPDAEPDHYRYGEKIVTDEQADVAVAVSYYDASPNYIVFNLEVENKGTEPFNFDPATCLLVPDVGPVSLAIDPEMELLSMDIQTIQQEKTRRTWGWIGAGALVAGTVVAITSDAGLEGLDPVGSSFASELAFSVTENLAFAVVNAQAASDFRRNAIPYADEIPVPENRFFWLDHAVRYTTIRPGEKAVGKVVFPRNDEAAAFSFNLEVQEKDFRFPFSQRVYKP